MVTAVIMSSLCALPAHCLQKTDLIKVTPETATVSWGKGQEFSQLRVRVGDRLVALKKPTAAHGMRWCELVGFVSMGIKLHGQEKTPVRAVE